MIYNHHTQGFYHSEVLQEYFLFTHPGTSCQIIFFVQNSRMNLCPPPWTCKVYGSKGFSEGAERPFPRKE